MLNFFERLGPYHVAAVETWYAGQRGLQLSLRAEEALYGPKLRPPCALSMTQLPTGTQVEQGLGLDSIGVSCTLNYHP